MAHGGHLRTMGIAVKMHPTLRRGAPLAVHHTALAVYQHQHVLRQLLLAHAGGSDEETILLQLHGYVAAVAGREALTVHPVCDLAQLMTQHLFFLHHNVLHFCAFCQKKSPNSVSLNYILMVLYLALNVKVFFQKI